MSTQQNTIINDDNVTLEAVVKKLTEQAGNATQVIAIKEALIDVKDERIENLNALLLERDAEIERLNNTISTLKGGEQ